MKLVGVDIGHYLGSGSCLQYIKILQIENLQGHVHVGTQGVHCDLCRAVLGGSASWVECPGSFSKSLWDVQDKRARTPASRYANLDMPIRKHASKGGPKPRRAFITREP